MLIESFLRCRVCRDGEIYHKEKGLIQGASMSPVLSNWYLQELDEFMEKQNYKWIRFADDIYIYTDSEEKGSEIYSVIERQLEERFELSLNE